MRIEKTVNIDTTVEVDVTLDDIVAAIGHESDLVSLGLCLNAINSIAKFLKAIPAAMIIQMTGEQRETIRKFLEEQSKRF